MQLRDIRRQQMFNTHLWVGGLQVANAACLENIKALSAKIIASFGKWYFFIVNILCINATLPCSHLFIVYHVVFFVIMVDPNQRSREIHRYGW